MAEEQGSAFGSVQERLNQIVDEVSAEDISLDDALKLYEEAVRLGLSACDLSEQDIEAFVAGEEATGAEGAGAAPETAGANAGAPEAAPAEDVAAAEAAPAEGPASASPAF